MSFLQLLQKCEFCFILPFPESVPTHWFKEQQFQHLNSWLQEFPSITANPVLLLLGFFVCSNFLPTPDGWLEVLAGLWLSTKVICFSKGREIPWTCWLSASERTNHRWECHKPTWNGKGWKITPDYQLLVFLALGNTNMMMVGLFCKGAVVLADL